MDESTLLVLHVSAPFTIQVEYCLGCCLALLLQMNDSVSSVAIINVAFNLSSIMVLFRDRKNIRGKL